MEICSVGHDEVCYETRKCPACDLYDETVKAHESETEKLNEEIVSLNEVITELRNDIANT